MIQKKYEFHTFDELKEAVSMITGAEEYNQASGVLIQLYNPKTDSDDDRIVDYINSNCLKACLTGITCANIADKEYDIKDNPIELNVTYFKSTKLKQYEFDMKSETSFVAGRIINEKLQEIADAKCMMICYSCGSAVINSFINEFNHFDIPIFGAKAGRSIRELNTVKVYGKNAGTDGIVVIIFCGNDLHLYMDNCLGFKEIGIEMLVTKTDGDNIISEIDHSPAAEVYSKYLNVRPNKYFVQNVCEFPMVFHRKGCVISRVPSAYGEDGSIHFTADVMKGETLRLSYGNSDNLLRIIKASVEGLRKFHPEAIYLFECGNRIRFLKDKAKCEPDSYRELSSDVSLAVGYAELFFTSARTGGALNSAIVAVGLSESGDSKNEIRTGIDVADEEDTREDERDYIPFVDRILHFLEITSTELALRNKELGRIAYTDQLTRVYNRWELEHKINEILDICNEDGSPACLIFMDIDHFKHVNDTFGHDAGDMVLQASVELIKENLEPRYVFGRWGGEEFICAMPDVSLDEAMDFAEHLRKKIEDNCFVTVQHITMSFGVTRNIQGDDLNSFVKRADQALYTAKESGRNRVVSN